MARLTEHTPEKLLLKVVAAACCIALAVGLIALWQFQVRASRDVVAISVMQQELAEIRDALVTYQAEIGGYPQSLSALVESSHAHPQALQTNHLYDPGGRPYQYRASDSLEGYSLASPLLTRMLEHRARYVRASRVLHFLVVIGFAGLFVVGIIQRGREDGMSSCMGAVAFLVVLLFTLHAASGWDTVRVIGLLPVAVALIIIQFFALWAITTRGRDLLALVVGLMCLHGVLWFMLGWM